MYAPDPIERMDARIDDMAHDMFSGVPDGQARCPGCKKLFALNDLIPVSPHPDAAFVCFDCLSPEDQLAYEAFERSINERPKV